MAVSSSSWVLSNCVGTISRANPETPISKYTGHTCLLEEILRLLNKWKVLCGPHLVACEVTEGE